MKRLKWLWAMTDRNRYVQYLRNLGAVIGENVYFVNPRKTFFDINRAGFISIGDECVICSGVSLVAHDYSWTIPMKAYAKICPSGGGVIKIGNNCFIGQNSLILRNVQIGNNVIIGAGSVVTKDCQGDSVYVGNPAHRIMSLDEYGESLRSKCLKDARVNILQIKKRNNGNVQERQMRNYEFLYLERTKQNEQQINSQSWIGCDKMKIVDLFRSTSPLDGVRDFSDFEKYLSDL